MKKLMLLISAAAIAGVAVASVTIGVNADRLWTKVVRAELSEPAAFPSPAKGQGHYFVMEAACSGDVSVKFVPSGTSITNDVGTITNGLLSATSPSGIPPVHQGDKLLFVNSSASATNDIVVTYSAEFSKNENVR